MVIHYNFIYSLNHPVQRIKQYHMKELFNSFNLNGHTLGVQKSKILILPLEYSYGSVDYSRMFPIEVSRDS